MINIHQLVYALSDSLDLVGVDDIYHGKRVAYMALECAHALGLRQSDKIDLFHASLLHDCGVSSTRIHNQLVFTLDWDGAEDHCIRGYQLLNLAPVLRHLSSIVLYHHTHWDAIQRFRLPFKTAQLANLIFMCDRVDALVAQHSQKTPGQSILVVFHTIREEIATYAGTLFCPELVEVFLAVSLKEVFWFHFESANLQRYFHTFIASLESDGIDLPELKQVAELFAIFVDAKSTYTADHSLDVAQLARFIAQKMQLAPEVCTKIEIAGLLHDLGKLRVPDEILEKRGPLDHNEFDTVKIHAYETHQILSQIGGLEDIADWASQHHEHLNGTGYPYHIQTLSQPARIIAVADIFQALAQKRPYRDYLKPIQILSILQDKAAKGMIDADVVGVVERYLQECWEISIRHSRKV